MLLALSLIVPSLAVDPVQIRVTDPKVREVVLECEGAKKLMSPVKEGLARFTEDPGRCKVIFVSEIGEIQGTAQYTCGANGCTKADVVRRQVDDAPGRVTIVVTDGSAPSFELKCTSYRERATVETNVAVFDNVPENEDCALYWKGGNSASRANKLGPGRWECHQTANTGICTRQ